MFLRVCLVRVPLPRRFCSWEKMNFSTLCRHFVATGPPRRIGTTRALSNCLAGRQCEMGTREIALRRRFYKKLNGPCGEPRFHFNHRSELFMKIVSYGAVLRAQREACTQHGSHAEQSVKKEQSYPAHLRFHPLMSGRRQARRWPPLPLSRRPSDEASATYGFMLRGGGTKARRGWA